MDIQLPEYTAEPVVLDAGQVVDWGHLYLQTEKFYNVTRGAGAIAFILDTAGEFMHPDLKPNTLPEYNRNVTNSPVPDVHGHGTHCAGIAAAVDNSVGVIGIAPEMYLVACKCLNDSGAGSFGWVADQIRYVADLELKPEHRVKRKIISMSLGGSPGARNPEELSNAINYAVSKGVFIVAAAGNWGAGDGSKSTVGPPGNHPAVLTVASSQRPGDQRSPFSSVGSEVELIAPGSSIYSTHLGDGYARLSGTSMACPQVTGLVGLLVSAYDFPGQNELVDFMTKHATDVLAKGKDNESGYGSPIVVPYLRHLPEPDPDPGPPPRPEPDPDPRPDPPQPDPEPEIPRRGNGVISANFTAGEPYGFLYRYGGQTAGLGIVQALTVSVTSDVQTARMSEIVQGYLRDFFASRAIILTEKMDFYDAAIYAGVFLELVASQDWVVEKYGLPLQLKVENLTLSDSGSAAVVTVNRQQIDARSQEDKALGGLRVLCASL